MDETADNLTKIQITALMRYTMVAQTDPVLANNETLQQILTHRLAACEKQKGKRNAS